MSKQRPIKLKIDVKKIIKAHLFAGAKGTYLDCAVWPNRDGPDQYGNTHYVVQEISKEAREAGEKGPIIGNLTLPDERQAVPERRPAPKREARDEGFADDPIPF